MVHKIPKKVLGVSFPATHFRKEKLFNAKSVSVDRDWNLVEMSLVPLCEFCKT